MWFHSRIPYQAVLSLQVVYLVLRLMWFIIAALQYRVLDYPDSTSDIVWLYDGNVQYFTRDHLPRFVAAAMIDYITHTWIGQCANSKLVTDTGSHARYSPHTSDVQYAYVGYSLL